MWACALLFVPCLHSSTSQPSTGHVGFEAPQKYPPHWHTDVTDDFIDEVARTPISPLLRGVHYDSTYDIGCIEQPMAYNVPPTEALFPYPNPSVLPYHVLSWQPAIFYFPRFFSMEECDHFVNRTKHRQRRSQVLKEVGLLLEDGDESFIDDVRTSSQAWYQNQRDIHLRRVENRIQTVLTGMTIQDLESLQILKYTEGQKYEAHWDFYDPHVFGRRDVQRAATIFAYLNNVSHGGETIFPWAMGVEESHDYTLSNCSAVGGVRVKPIKGSAVVFYDMRRDGTLDRYSLHGSCPVKGNGVKWAATAWASVVTPDDVGKELYTSGTALDDVETSDKL